MVNWSLLNIKYILWLDNLFQIHLIDSICTKFSKNYFVSYLKITNDILGLKKNISSVKANYISSLKHFLPGINCDTVVGGIASL